MSDVEVVKWTEAEMLTRLRKRVVSSSGNGPSAVMMSHVRDAAGFDSRRSIDALAMGVWPGQGLPVDAFEIKVSRSDWLREMRDPSKAEAFLSKCDRFWIVAPRGIVKTDELPGGWGLMVNHGPGLRVEVKADLRHEGKSDARRPLPAGFDRSFTASLLRASEKASTTAWSDGRQAGYQEGREDASSGTGHQARREKAELQRLRLLVREFEKSSGLTLDGLFRDDEQARQVGKAVKSVLDGEARIQNARNDLARLAGQAKRIVQHIDEELEG